MVLDICEHIMSLKAIEVLRFQSLDSLLGEITHSVWNRWTVYYGDVGLLSFWNRNKCKENQRLTRENHLRDGHYLPEVDTSLRNV